MDTLHVRTVWDGDYAIQHYWYVDDLGMKKNSFDLVHHPKDGPRVYHPFFGKPRVSNTPKGAAFLGDDTTPYKEEEYLEMLREQVAKLQQS